MTLIDPCDSLAVAARHLSSRITDGSTLWAVAPGLDDHARHLAVEFVHPASVGAMAVPAIAVCGNPEQVIERLREQIRTGDIIVSMGSIDSALIAELSIRAVAWGADHIHLGWAQNPGAGFLDPRSFCVQLGLDRSAERFLTRSYHLLWELTFICLQNRKLTTPASEDVLATASCSVCADEATTMEISELLTNGTARVRTACGPEVVDVSLIGEVQVYDLLLVHAGVAIRRLPAFGNE